jgi:hypothetical protein
MVLAGASALKRFGQAVGMDTSPEIATDAALDSSVRVLVYYMHRCEIIVGRKG